MPASPDLVFAACAPGLEAVLARELVGLGLDARPVPGGAEAAGDEAVALACIGSRVADAVALRAWAGTARDLERALAEARRRFGAAAVASRRDGDRATVSVDAVGGPLYKRGWRARIGAAPLRETVAAGMLLHAGYAGDEPFLDPMCGSGTLAIEAFEIAARRAPGRARRFLFEAWPGQARRAHAVRARLAAGERAPPAPIVASDRNGGAVRLAGRNARAAGAGGIRIDRRDAAEADPQAGAGLLAVNPPWGARLEADPAPAWAALAALLGRLPAWRAVVLAPDRGLDRALARPASGALRVRVGGRACRVLTYAP